MQEEENKKGPMVDIDTSGPGADVELPEEKKPEGEIETKEEDSSPAPQAEEPREEKAEGSDAQPEAKQEEKPEEKKEELETYSKDVQRRISKLTRKWREAQRQADEQARLAGERFAFLEPQQRLSFYSDILRGVPSTQIQTLTGAGTPQVPIFQQALGAGITGLGLYGAGSKLGVF